MPEFAEELSTTQVALARGAGREQDLYVPGTVRERAYIRAKSTIHDMGDSTLDELSDDMVPDVDLNQMPASTALARPQRSTRTKVDWSHLLKESEDESGDDDDFDWDV